MKEVKSMQDEIKDDEFVKKFPSFKDLIPAHGLFFSKFSIADKCIDKSTLKSLRTKLEKGCNRQDFVSTHIHSSFVGAIRCGEFCKGCKRKIYCPECKSNLKLLDEIEGVQR